MAPLGSHVSTGSPVHAALSASQGPSAKRKRALDTPRSRKKRTRPVPAKRQPEDEAPATSEEASGINEAFAMMDGRLLSDYLAQKIKRFEKQLSSVELDDRHISDKAFRDTSGWDQRRDLVNLPAYLERFFHRTGSAAVEAAAATLLASAPETNGAPHTLVVTGAGIRAADLVRALRKFRTPQADVAKLFAKHIKLKEAEDYVKKTRIGIAVGTPTRILDLLKAGALSVERLDRIVVDSSYVDQKRRGIFDMRETFTPLMEFLSRPELKARYGASEKRLDLLFY
ncbi:MAG: hypothetical protein M1826_001141 [Phylliscum demangeonii]|nr:MAG: hypothetical protein M1826_001141 [Phylliscum demangeonii]